MRFYSVIRAIIHTVDFRESICVEVEDPKIIELFTDPKYGYNGRLVYTEEQWMELTGMKKEEVEKGEQGIKENVLVATLKGEASSLPYNDMIDWNMIKRPKLLAVLEKVDPDAVLKSEVRRLRKQGIIRMLVDKYGLGPQQILDLLEQVA